MDKKPRCLSAEKNMSRSRSPTAPNKDTRAGTFLAQLGVAQRRSLQSLGKAFDAYGPQFACCETGMMIPFFT